MLELDGEPPIGIEGEESREWILVDFVDVVVHIMRQQPLAGIMTLRVYGSEAFLRTRSAGRSRFAGKAVGIKNCFLASGR